MILRKEGEAHPTHPTEVKPKSKPKMSYKSAHQGNIRGMKRWGGDLLRHEQASQAYKDDNGQIERALINIAFEYAEGDINDFDVREFMKRLGKNKYGGILHFKCILPKKFVKYLPKKAKVYKCLQDPNLYAA